jgi:hypothetical protein
MAAWAKIDASPSFVPIFLLGFSMFNRSDFDQLSGKEVTYWSARDGCRGLYYVTYPAFAFQYPDSQETIRIARAPKQQGENGLKFWLHAECVDWHPERESYFLGYVLTPSLRKFRKLFSIRWSRIRHGI